MDQVAAAPASLHLPCPGAVLIAAVRCPTAAPQAPPSKADPKKTMTADCVLGKQTPDVKTL